LDAVCRLPDHIELSYRHEKVGILSAQAWPRKKEEIFTPPFLSAEIIMRRLLGARGGAGQGLLLTRQLATVVTRYVEDRALIYGSRAPNLVCLASDNPWSCATRIWSRPTWIYRLR
jgi:hypothetical protein